jgi:hypothetical protein
MNLTNEFPLPVSDEILEWEMINEYQGSPVVLIILVILSVMAVLALGIYLFTLIF